MKNAVIVYIPPPSLPTFNSEAFIQNMRQNPTANRLIVVSDHDYSESVKDFASFVKIISPDDVFKGAALIGEKRNVDVPNLVWLTALRIAKTFGVSNMLFLESDCRVLGQGWDQKMFDEFESSKDAPMFGGSIVAYNVANCGRKALDRYFEFVWDNRKNPFPIPAYGWKGAADETNCCVYPNGAGTICSLAAVESLFSAEELAATVRTARAILPYDQEIGKRLWRVFGVDTYKFLLHMKTQYSAYGNVLSSEQERCELLTSGKVSMVHQVKSAWIPQPNVPNK